MAFPTIQTANTTNGTQTTNASSWTLTYPGSLALGDLILCFIATDGAPGAPTFPANWVVKYSNNNGANSIIAAVKSSLGTESGTFSVNVGASEQGGWRIFRITGWFGGTLGTTGTDDADGVSFGIGVNPVAGASANPNPGTTTPAWGSADNLWFACCSVDTSRTVSVYPLAGNNSADVSGGSGGATLGLCTTTSAVGSLDPGTFTVSASDDWLAGTVGVRPAGVVTQPPRYGYTNFQDPGLF